MKISLRLWAAIILSIVLITGCRGTSSSTPTQRIAATQSTALVATQAPAETIVSPSTPGPTAAPNTMVPAPVVLPTGWKDRSIFKANLVRDQQGILQGLPGASVYHIDVTINDDLISLTGKEEILYTNREAVPLSEIYLRLFPNLVGGTETVSNLLVNDAPVAPVLEQQNSAVKIPLAKSLAVGDQVVLRMDFNLKVPGADASNFDIVGYAAHVLSLATFYPLIPAYDDKGWHIEIPAPYGDQTYSDTSFYEVRISAPENQKVVASGSVVNNQKSGNREIVTMAAGPVRDFYITASDWFVEAHETVGETTIHSFAFDQFQSTSTQALEFAKNAFKSYSQRFGEYPYTEFSIAATPTKALGVEYPEVVVIATILYDLKSTLGAARPIYFESTVAHEIAHQWFYGVVGDDQVNQPWLDEAMAQYSTFLYYEDTHGDVAAGNYESNWEQRWERVKRQDIPIGMPTTSYTPDNYSPIVYGRGPIFINLLSHNMGGEQFSVFLHDYYKTNMFGIATTDEFEQLAQKDCGCDLSKDFNAWVK